METSQANTTGKQHNHIGSSFDDFLREECIYDVVTAQATQQIQAWLQQKHELPAPQDASPPRHSERQRRIPREVTHHPVNGRDA